MGALRRDAGRPESNSDLRRWTIETPAPERRKEAIVMSGKLVESLDASGTSWLVNCVLLWFDQPLTEACHGAL